ncbi:MAG: glycosyltransferase family 2 protein [Rhodospirillales bacterium]|jgi:glycosyltransferase involved in cell wall biosynthesis|nr:glycosyltransferase family 2 protein [Rhodospirillales bacterium]MDP6883424.1 glycosyltransferase family 2 protein [Rhodospirillales bacterium]
MSQTIPEPGSNAGKTPILAAVVPCYREVDHVLGVLDGIGPEVGHIFVVDDACPDGTGRHVRDHCKDGRVSVVTHERNEGVGGATLSGYRAAVEAGADIIVKLDGDGQMDPKLIPALVSPIACGKADYAKGNRFHDLDGLKGMPATRIFGNLVLSFLSKMSSGYWNLFDPTNGFTAIHAKVARQLLKERISKGYFFESDMLFRLNLLGAVVADVPMEARYGAEKSGLRIHRAILEFAAKHWLNAVKRIFYSYYLRDFGAASVELLLGVVLVVFGGVFGALEWYQSTTSGIPATAGTVILAALPIILGTQFLIAFINFDTRNIPKSPLHPGL